MRGGWLKTRWKNFLAYWLGMERRLLNYGFPFFMLVIEGIFREAAKIDVSDLLGPTLAAAGIGLILPLTTPKPVEIPENLRASLPEGIKNGDVELVGGRDQRVIRWCWICIFATIAVWVLDLYLAHEAQSPNYQIPLYRLGPVTMRNFVALAWANWLVGVLLSEWKEQA